MVHMEERLYQSLSAHHTLCYLGADIGGTNSNFGFFEKKKNGLELILSIHLKSQTITHFEQAVLDVLKYVYQKHKITVRRACFAGAGIVNTARDYCKPTNLPWAIDAKKISVTTHLECVVIANDFEVIGHGLSLINAQDILKVKDGRAIEHGNRVILGAGTGLGMCMLLWDHHEQRYMPLASEGGHTDFAASSQQEFDIVSFIQNNRSCYDVSWEQLLSGNGITTLYNFFKSFDTLGLHQSHTPHADEIFNSKNNDKECTQTYELYAKLYGRFAKHCALNALALGGVYIAGGIATHNVPLFSSDLFLKEFVQCSKHQEQLNTIPIFLIKDYNVSLYGAAEFMQLEGLCSV